VQPELRSQLRKLRLQDQRRHPVDPHNTHSQCPEAHRKRKTLGGKKTHLLVTKRLLDALLETRFSRSPIGVPGTYDENGARKSATPLREKKGCRPASKKRNFVAREPRLAG
jgi:hypothetical protein